MFIKKSSVDEITSSLEENLNLAYNHQEIAAETNRASVINYLTIASEILDAVGLEKESSSVTKVLKKVADATFGDTMSDPALPHTSEQAVSNLEHKGWMFNTDDVSVDEDDSDDADLTVEQNDVGSVMEAVAERLQWGSSKEQIQNYLKSEGFVGEEAFLMYKAAQKMNSK